MTLSALHRAAFFFVLIIAVFLSASRASAESIVELEKNDLLSPFTTENRWIFLSGAALTITLVLLEDQISDPAQKATVRHKPVGKFSPLGDYSGQLIPNLVYIAAMGSYGIFGKHDPAMKSAEVMMRATTSAAILSSVLKTIVREPRPTNSRDLTSFPSGHSTTAFTFASVVASENGPYWGGAAYTLATLVAFSRMNDNRHLLHDVVGGATIGLSYGVSVARRAHANGADQSSRPEESSIMVVPSEDAHGLAALYAFTF